MVTRTDPARGGFKRKIRLGEFIRDTLALGPRPAHAIYIAYKQAAQGDLGHDAKRLATRRIKNAITGIRRTKPRERVKISEEEQKQLFEDWKDTYVRGGTSTINGETLTFNPHRIKSKHVISYNGFMHYIYVCRQLGLVEYTGEENPAHVKSDAPTSSTEWYYKHPSKVIRGINLTDPAWQNLWQAYSLR